MRRFCLPLAAQAQSLYKSDMTTQHVRVGKRGVCLSPEAMQAVRGAAGEAVGGERVAARGSAWPLPSLARAQRRCLAGPAFPTFGVQYEESRKQAEKNKQIGKATNSEEGAAAGQVT